MTDVANAYGQALYDLAKAEDLADPILTQLLMLEEIFAKEPDFLRLLQSANLSGATSSTTVSRESSTTMW